ncbi:MAG: phospho-N-acetylmuramoyl-pentapeptide-transferase [Gammaproteobacteria bacterium]|nr:phospho-N-acetylmuramoyl-pentapeptide-transferase [Gammaproteobacteria bacterium]
MLLWLTEWLAEHVSAFNVFGYITFRTLVSTGTALFISLLFGPLLIRWLERRQIGDVIRSDGPEQHAAKEGTPTMGGLLILVSVFIASVCWVDLANRQIWVVLAVLLSFGVIGFFDDYLKLAKTDKGGLSAKLKFFLQIVCASAVALILYQSATNPAETALLIPFFKEISIPLGWGFVILTVLMIVGMSNAVNLTDGLDGLAILPAVMIVGALGLFTYAVGHFEFAAYLQIPYIEGMGEVAIVCGAIVGAGLGFLWFNSFPAQMIMGDIGALPLGAALGVIGVLARQEIVLLIMSGLFVLETASVIAQVGSFKLRGKRVLRMAPLHHHFELKGWPEPKVTVRFWIITFLLVMIGLATLKLR